MTSLYQHIQAHAEDKPDHEALRHRLPGGVYEAVTYGELAAKAQEYAAASVGATPDGAIVPMYASKSADLIAAMLGVLGAGRAFACLNRKLRLPQIETILDATQATIALVDGPGLMTLKDAAVSDSSVARVRWWVIRGSSFTTAHQRAMERLAQVTSVSFCTAESHRVHTGHHAPSPDYRDRIGCCLFTSGSTGTPKGVLISEADLQARAAAEVDWYCMGADDVLLSILPFSFDVGLNQLLSALMCGCQLVLLDSWLPADILAVTEACRVTGISSTPSIWQDMINSGMRFDTSSRHAALRYITISGGDLSPEYLRRLPELVEGVGIFKTYGQTEAFRCTSLRPHEFAARPQSVGKPFHKTCVYVVRDDGNLCEPNEVGQVVHTGLGVMLGYLGGNDPQNKLRANPFCSQDDPAPMAVFTGDLGYLDDGGYLYLCGREDDMLKVADNRIYPREIVDQMLTLPEVREAEVVGVRDEVGHTHLIAVVALSDGADQETSRIRHRLSACLPSYMIPEQFVIVSALPRTSSGKPDRQALASKATAMWNRARQAEK